MPTALHGLAFQSPSPAGELQPFQILNWSVRCTTKERWRRRSYMCPRLRSLEKSHCAGALSNAELSRAKWIKVVRFEKVPLTNNAKIAQGVSFANKVESAWRMPFENETKIVWKATLANKAQISRKTAFRNTREELLATQGRYHVGDVAHSSCRSSEDLLVYLSGHPVDDWRKIRGK